MPSIFLVTPDTPSMFLSIDFEASFKLSFPFFSRLSAPGIFPVGTFVFFDALEQFPILLCFGLVRFKS